MKRDLLVLKNISFEYEPGKEILSEINLSLKRRGNHWYFRPLWNRKKFFTEIDHGLRKTQNWRDFYNDETLCGEKIFVPPNKKGIGLVLQEKALFPHLNSLENVKFGLRGSKASKEEQAIKFQSY